MVSVEIRVEGDASGGFREEVTAAHYGVGAAAYGHFYRVGQGHLAAARAVDGDLHRDSGTLPVDEDVIESQGGLGIADLSQAGLEEYSVEESTGLSVNRL